MLLMKDRSFLYELRAYLLYVKVGEHTITLKRLICLHSNVWTYFALNSVLFLVTESGLPLIIHLKIP